jgi:hypothetical protein
MTLRARYMRHASPDQGKILATAEKVAPGVASQTLADWAANPAHAKLF